MTQHLKVVPSYIIGYWAGDYFQALRHITAPAAPMVRQQSSLLKLLLNVHLWDKKSDIIIIINIIRQPKPVSWFETISLAEHAETKKLFFLFGYLFC